MSSVSNIVLDAAKWAKGKHWPFRLLLLVYLFYVGVAKLSDSNAWELFGGISLGIHELGHVVFGIGPELLMFMGTSWLALTVFGISDYQQDASRMLIPLVGLTGDPQHDWNNIFSALGAGSMLAGLWLLLNMVGIKEEKKRPWSG